MIAFVHIGRFTMRCYVSRIKQPQSDSDGFVWCWPWWELPPHDDVCLYWSNTQCVIDMNLLKCCKLTRLTFDQLQQHHHQQQQQQKRKRRKPFVEAVEMQKAMLGHTIDWSRTSINDDGDCLCYCLCIDDRSWSIIIGININCYWGRTKNGWARTIPTVRNEKSSLRSRRLLMSRLVPG